MNMEFVTPPKQNQTPESVPQMPNAAPQMSPPKPKNKSKKWLWLLILLLLLVGATAYGYMWWKDKNKKPAAQTAQSTATEKKPGIECSEDFSVYENSDLGFGFCHPKSWGVVSTSEDKLASADTGSRYVIKFDSKPEVRAAVVSTDWTTTVGRGGECYFPSNETPNFAEFSTEWETDGEGADMTFAKRGIDSLIDNYLINEDVGEFFGAVCYRGAVIVNTAIYPQVVVSYTKALNSDIATPNAHVESPNVLLTVADRADLLVVVKSVKKL